MNKENVTRPRMALCHMRLTGYDKEYYANKLKEFVCLFDSRKILSVHFGKQDIRGGISITLIDINRCVLRQKFFSNKWELLGYVGGVLDAQQENKPYCEFTQYMK